MNVISKRTLVKFYEQHPQAKSALEVWHSDARKAVWNTPEDIKQVYASASFFKKIIELFLTLKEMTFDL